MPEKSINQQWQAGMEESFSFAQVTTVGLIVFCFFDQDWTFSWTILGAIVLLVKFWKVIEPYCSTGSIHYKWPWCTISQYRSYQRMSKKKCCIMLANTYLYMGWQNRWSKISMCTCIHRDSCWISSSSQALFHGTNREPTVWDTTLTKKGCIVLSTTATFLSTFFCSLYHTILINTLLN